MASEPKKPMEQMLEALAKARRAQFGDDPKMPNPMRTRLYEEIARVGAADDEESESRPSWITMFWPRLTVAAALATLIVLVPAIWWNQSHQPADPDDVALRGRASGAADRAVARNPAVNAPEATVNLADNSKIKVEPAAAPASEAEGLASSARLAQGRAVTQLPNQVKKHEIASAKIQAAPAAAPAAGADSKAKSDTMAAVAPAVTQPSPADGLGITQQLSQQALVQSFRNNAQVSRSSNVLKNFQVEQQGSDIRVLDADGSTYTGKVEQSANNAQLDSPITARRDAAKQKRSYAAKAVPENESATPQSYFRATGFNVSLKKRVVFEGNYAAPPAQQPGKPIPNEKERSEQNGGRTRIVGTVRVNGEAPVEVDAIAETPAAKTKKDQSEQISHH
ncbi:MAG: hypothetical protein ACJ8LL_13610 [Candidatus Udaeobacter sp.]